MSRQFETTYTMERDDDEFDVDIVAEYFEGERARGYGGPPERSSPGCDPEISIISVHRGKEKIFLTDEEYKKIEQYLLENYEEDEPDYDDFNIEDEREYERECEPLDD